MQNRLAFHVSNQRRTNRDSRSAGATRADPMTAPRQRLHQFLVGIIFFTLAALSPKAPTAQSLDYKVSIGDLLRIAVSDRQEISGEYRVGLAGNVALPLIGRVSAAGLRPSELESAIVGKAEEVLRLIEPLVVVEVLEYQPLYVLGDVNNPGKYPYTSRIKVLQAIALAGGRRQLEPGQGGRSVTDLIIRLTEAQRDAGVLSLQYTAARGRAARLRAERDDLETIGFPDDILRGDKDQRIADLIAVERGIFNSRRQALSDMTDIQARLIEQFDAEVTALHAQSAATSQALALLDEEISLVGNLQAKGLAPKTQLLEIKRSRFLASIEQRDIEVAVTGVQRAITETRISIAEERNRVMDEVLLSLEETNLEVSELHARLTAALEIVRQVREAVAVFRPDLVEDVVTSITVLRDQGAGLETLEADESTEVLPGDVVRVERMTGVEAWPAIPVEAPPENTHSDGSEAREQNTANRGVGDNAKPPLE